jgi:CRP-like cAMP-binding protein
VSTERKFKKGEKLFSEGDQLPNFFVLQSGKVSLYIERAGQRTEVDQPQIGHVIGEQGVFAFPRQVFNAEAISEVKVVEIPIEPIKTVFEKSPAPYKLFVKALGDELRRLRGVVKSAKMENEAGKNQKLIRIYQPIN